LGHPVSGAEITIARTGDRGQPQASPRGGLDGHWKFLPEVVPDIDANLVNFYGGERAKWGMSVTFGA